MLHITLALPALNPYTLYGSKWQFGIDRPRKWNMTMSRRDTIGAVVLVAVFVALIVTLYLTLKPSGPVVGYEDNFFVQQSVRVQNEKQSK